MVKSNFAVLNGLASICRSSHQRCSIKIGFLKNFTKLTGKKLSQSLFYNKVAGLRPVILLALLKKRLWRICFPVNFVKFLRTPVSIEHVRWLLLICLLLWWIDQSSNKSVWLIVTIVIKGLFRIRSNIYDITFCKIGKKIKSFYLFLQNIEPEMSDMVLNALLVTFQSPEFKEVRNSRASK